MRRLSMFNFVTLDGYFEGPARGDISWHVHGAEENEYSIESMKSGSILLFGRKTYELMAGYWPSAQAIQNYPVVADGMNNAEKIVFSKTLKKAEWNNTRVVTGDIVEEMRRMKQAPGKDLTVLGSGSIVTQFAASGLFDEYQIMVDPVILGSGTNIFKNISNKLRLKLISTRAFHSGVVLLCYRPM